MGQTRYTANRTEGRTTITVFIDYVACMTYTLPTNPETRIQLDVVDESPETPLERAISTARSA